MAVPGIDLYVKLEAGERHRLLGLLPDLSRQLSAQGYALAKITFNDEHLIPDPNFPDSPGLHSGLTFIKQHEGRDTQRVWKLDLWGWDSQFYALRHDQYKGLEETFAGPTPT